MYIVVLAVDNEKIHFKYLINIQQFAHKMTSPTKNNNIFIT